MDNKDSDVTRLVRRAIDGDIPAFEALIRKYEKYIYSFVVGVANNSDIDDIVQEAIIAAWRNISTLRSPFAFTQWIRMLTVRACLDYREKQGKQFGKTVGLEMIVRFRETDTDNIPEENFEKISEAEVLYQCISKLPDSQRIALYMYYYENMKQKDIAGMLGITITTVGTNITKARNNLKKMFERNSDMSEMIPAAFDAGVSSRNEMTSDEGSATDKALAALRDLKHKER